MKLNSKSSSDRFLLFLNAICLTFGEKLVLSLILSFSVSLSKDIFVFFVMNFKFLLSPYYKKFHKVSLNPTSFNVLVMMHFFNNNIDSHE